MENKIKQFFIKNSMVDCKKVYIVCKGSTNLSDYDQFLQDFNEEYPLNFEFYFLIQKGNNYYDAYGNAVAMTAEIKNNMYPATEGLINAPALYIGQKGYTQMEMYLLGILPLFRSFEEEVNYQNKNQTPSNLLYWESSLQRSNHGNNCVQLYKDYLKSEDEKTDGYKAKLSANGKCVTKQEGTANLSPTLVKKLQKECGNLDKNGEEKFKYKVSELQKIERTLNELINEHLEVLTNQMN